MTTLDFHEEADMKPSIVIAWYDPNFLQEIGRHLEQHGYEVITFENGGETLDHLRGHRVDVLIRRWPCVQGILC